MSADTMLLADRFGTTDNGLADEAWQPERAAAGHQQMRGTGRCVVCVEISPRFAAVTAMKRGGWSVPRDSRAGQPSRGSAESAPLPDARQGSGGG